jgi:hypothetical protein
MNLSQHSPEYSSLKPAQLFNYTHLQLINYLIGDCYEERIQFKQNVDFRSRSE